MLHSLFETIFKSLKKECNYFVAMEISFYTFHTLKSESVKGMDDREKDVS